MRSQGHRCVVAPARALMSEAGKEPEGCVGLWGALANPGGCAPCEAGWWCTVLVWPTMSQRTGCRSTLRSTIAARVGAAPVGSHPGCDHLTLAPARNAHGGDGRQMIVASLVVGTSGPTPRPLPSPSRSASLTQTGRQLQCGVLNGSREHHRGPDAMDERQEGGGNMNTFLALADCRWSSAFFFGLVTRIVSSALGAGLNRQNMFDQLFMIRFTHVREPSGNGIQTGFFGIGL